ncbi:2014_t:CDS:10 [Funneliformis geosporum]|uniref:2014_t:CDS:1 n=1 Tax=Funneliformis geosporum TaxID=1117311 RepID=A0A9W4T476_9GLOM|nr:2014_t:CDS:10 [Funneliformis geosporum]
MSTTYEQAIKSLELARRLALGSQFTTTKKIKPEDKLIIRTLKKYGKLSDSYKKLKANEINQLKEQAKDLEPNPVEKKLIKIVISSHGVYSVMRKVLMDYIRVATSRLELRQDLNKEVASILSSYEQKSELQKLAKEGCASCKEAIVNRTPQQEQDLKDKKQELAEDNCLLLMRKEKFKGIKTPTPQHLKELKQRGYTQKDIATVYGVSERTGSRKSYTQQKMANYLSKKSGEEIKQLNHLQKISKFKKLIPNLPQTRIIAIDECGFHLNETPRYGYSHKSSRAGYTKPELIQGGMKTENFHNFLTNLKLHSESKHYLIMDNLRVHKAKQACIKLGLNPIRELLASKNIETLFLPPYTPEMNPVEYCFNLIRQWVEKNKPRTYEKLKLVIAKIGIKAIKPEEVKKLNRKFYEEKCRETSNEN